MLSYTRQLLRIGLRSKNSPRMISLSLIRKAIVPTWASTELTKANDFNGSTAKRDLKFTKPGGRGGPYTSTYVLRTTPANIIPRKESTVCLLPVGSAEPGQLWMAQNASPIFCLCVYGYAMHLSLSLSCSPAHPLCLSTAPSMLSACAAFVNFKSLLLHLHVQYFMLVNEPTIELCPRRLILHDLVNLLARACLWSGIKATVILACLHV